MSTARDTEQTKARIARALFELMGEKPFGKITVQDIADRAGVGRATYYRHFRDKEDVIVRYFDSTIAEADRLLARPARTRDDYYEVAFVVFSLLKRKQALFRLLQECGLERLYLTYLNKILVEHYLSQGPDVPELGRDGFDETVARYSAYYAAGCLFNVSMEWVRGGCAESVKLISDIYISHVFSEGPEPHAPTRARRGAKRP